MTQKKKKSAYRTAVQERNDSSGTAAWERGRPARPRSRGDNSNRRMVTFGIVVIGILIAVGVLVASAGGVGIGSGASQSASSPSQGQQAAVKLDTAKIAVLQDRARQNPSDLGTLIDLGNTYYDASQWTDAIPWYEKALVIAPSNTDVRTDLGTAYYYSGNNDKAKEQWLKVLDQDPNKVQAHYNLGVMYSHLTPPDMDSASKEWETVIKLAPASDQAKSAEQSLKNIGKR